MPQLEELGRLFQKFFGANEQPKPVAAPVTSAKIPDGLYLSSSGNNVNFKLMHDGVFAPKATMELTRSITAYLQRNRIMYSGAYHGEPHLLSSAIDPKGVGDVHSNGSQWVAMPALYQYVREASLVWSHRRGIKMFDDPPAELRGVKPPAPAAARD